MNALMKIMVLVDQVDDFMVNGIHWDFVAKGMTLPDILVL
jgi:hypothetical protein